MSPVSAVAASSAPDFDFTSLFARDLPPPSAKWGGFTKYHFIGGNNDADMVPVDLLAAAATTVLQREGRNLATYNLLTGPHGYLPLRQFLVGKLKRDAAIACVPDDILITSGSLQGLDLVNSVLLDKGCSNRTATKVRSTGWRAAASRRSASRSIAMACGRTSSATPWRT
jgi:2-aminoadipate transaminase